jgi:hypothetical protein
MDCSRYKYRRRLQLPLSLGNVLHPSNLSGQEHIVTKGLRYEYEHEFEPEQNRVR